MSVQPTMRQKAIAKATGKPHLYTGHIVIPENPNCPVIVWHQTGPQTVNRHAYKVIIEIERSWFGERGLGI